MRADDGGFVKFIEVKAICHGAGQRAEFRRQRVALRIAVKYAAARNPTTTASRPVMAATGGVR